MPLSEEELRLLEQMERALVEEDPKFASTLRGTSIRKAARRRAIIAAFVFVVGIVVLMGGAISGYWQIGIVGFVIMLGSATVGTTVVRGRRVTGVDLHPSGHPSRLRVVDGGRSSRRDRPAPARSSGFMDTLRNRWRRRRDERGF